MSEQRGKDATTQDLFWLVVAAFALLFITSMMDSCHAGWRYRDLRDRLQRLEQQK